MVYRLLNSYLCLPDGNRVVQNLQANSEDEVAARYQGADFVCSPFDWRVYFCLEHFGLQAFTVSAIRAGVDL